MTTSDLTPLDLFRLAVQARNEAEAQFESAIPGWPDHVTGPVGQAGLDAMKMLRQRESELTDARQRLLDSVRKG